ncbi:hypothetical protein DEV91_1281, partial [Phyllobacterium brassicacearum]
MAADAVIGGVCRIFATTLARLDGIRISAATGIRRRIELPSEIDWIISQKPLNLSVYRYPVSPKAKDPLIRLGRGRICRAMEDVRDLDAEAPDLERPVVCSGERPTRLIGEVAFCLTFG